jgi:2-octaprenyl-6-methoxyphenol hydroxylase
LIVADGARSKLREALGVGVTEHDYRQSAIVANVQIAQHHAGHRAYERFTAAGPLALLPGKNGLYTVVMARPSAAIAELMDMPDERFLQLVQEAFGFRLGRLRRIGQRSCYPLALTKADALIAERAVMIGNAAHGLHPVAGQGFNLGLRDVATLAELLVDAQRTNGAEFDAGSAELLDIYLAWRGDDQRKVVAFTDGLIRFFALPGKTLAAGRGLGLTMFDVFPAGKRELARQTMGLAGRMTRLARGLDL